MLRTEPFAQPAVAADPVLAYARNQAAEWKVVRHQRGRHLQVCNEIIEHSRKGSIMDQGNLQRETEQVVKRVLPVIREYSTFGKKEFESIHGEILRCLHENTGISTDTIVEKMDTVLKAMPNEYGRLPEGQRSWEALIGYLYVRYLKELGTQ